MPLPAKVVGGYWEYWGATPLAQINPGYNVVFVAFAKGTSTTSGSLILPPMDQSVASFKTDVQTLKSRGIPVILSIGGWNDIYPDKYGYTLSTSTQQSEAIASLTSLITTYGFDGIDWDLEHSINATAVVNVTKALKAKFPSLIVSMAPMRSNTSVYKSIATSLGSQFDLIGPQYYNRALTEAQSLADIIAGTKDLANTYGAAKVMIGTMQTDDSGVAGDTNNTVTIATCISAWNTLVALYPTLRGEYVWAINLDKDRGYQFVNQVGPVITSAVGPPPPPPPTPPPPAPSTDVVIGTASYPLAGVNIARGTDALVVYTNPPYSRTPTNIYGTEATVVSGKVVAVVDRSVTKTTAGTVIPSNGVVLSGHGKAKTWLNTYAKIGATVQLPSSVKVPW